MFIKEPIKLILNMKNIIFSVLFLSLSWLANGQNDDNARIVGVKKAIEKEIKEDGWHTGGGLGLDLGQLLQINPKVGAGENRLGIGGAVSIFALLKKGLMSFDNTGSLNIGLIKLGTGVLPSTSSFEKVKQPFQKSIDELRINSRLGYRINPTSKFSYAVDFGFISQLTPTYRGTDNKNYIKEFQTSNITSLLVSKFLAPAYITFAPGLDYKPSESLSFFLSPFGFKSVVVADNDLARLNIHGNKWNSINDFKQTDHQLGGLLKGAWTDKFAEDHVVVNSRLTLFSNYLNQPGNIDVDWINEIGFNIFKGFQINIWTNLFYDHDVQVQVTDYDQVGGVRGTGRRVSFTEQLLIKYNVIF